MSTFNPQITYKISQITVDGRALSAKLASEMLPDIPVPHWAPDPEGFYGWIDLSYPNNTNFYEHFTLYNEMVAWIQSNVQNWHTNTLYTKIGDCIYIKLRKRTDATMFILKFGS